MSYPFWSDDFDMDLPKVIPDVLEVVGDLADTRLWTYGGASRGRLNHPSVWNSARGMMVAYFGTDDTGSWKAAGCWTDQPIVECTWLEVLRDAWPHQYLIVVDREPVWDTNALTVTFMDLMYDLRGWRRLDGRIATEHRVAVLAGVKQATEQLAEVISNTRGVR